MLPMQLPSPVRCLLLVKRLRDDLDSMSSGSMSPDLGDTRHQGSSLSPQWEGELELELNTASDYDNDSKENDSGTAGDSIAWRDLTDSISIVREYSVWNLIRDSLCPPDVLRLRTIGRGWNDAKLYGDSAALWFFLMTNKDETPATQLLEWPCLRLP